MSGRFVIGPISGVRLLQRLSLSANRPILACYASSSVMQDQINTWKKAHELFNSKERDTKNFPSKLDYGSFDPPVRLGWIPEKFFTFFYEKTGVTGPYMLGVGALTYLFSKEIWVLNHHFAHFLTFWIVMWAIQRKLGPMMSAYFDKELDARDDAMLYKPVRDTKEAVEANIVDVNKVIDQNEAKLVIGDIKKENLALQLEAIYRQRLHHVYSEVKKRLDYQLQMQTTRANFERDHMVNWIVSNVFKSVTPQSEKEALSSCINHLRSLSKAA